MNQTPAKAFRFCPSCGREAAVTGVNPFSCTCGFSWYFSPCVAVGAILADPDGQVLFLRRKKDPGRDQLGIPGGFVDAGETVEDALRREVHEEMNLKVRQMQFLASFPNTYAWKGIDISVADLFFVCAVETFETIAAEASEVAGWHFCYPKETTLKEMAFESNRKAVQLYLQTRKLS